MSRMLEKCVLWGFLLGLVFMSRTAAAAAQEEAAYPDHTVRIVVPYSAGGSVDVVARIIAAQLSTRLSRQFIVDNVPGAGGNIGTMRVVSAQPDGYTLLLSGPNITIAPALLAATTRFDPNVNFTHIGLLGTTPTVFVVKSDSPLRSLADMLASAREGPGRITYGVPGAGSPSHLAMEFLKRQTKASISAIPYKGSSPAMVDLFAGIVSVVPTVLSGPIGYIKSGQLRALAVTSAARDPLLPQVPTVAETIPDFEVLTWLGVSGPKGMSPQVRATLEAALKASLADAAVAAQMLNVGFKPSFSDGDSMTSMIRKESTEYSKLITEANLKAD